MIILYNRTLTYADNIFTGSQETFYTDVSSTISMALKYNSVHWTYYIIDNFLIYAAKYKKIYFKL